MDSPRVYLDANATTRPAPAVREAVARTLAEGWGNASSLHTRGRRAAAILSESRAEVARWLGASPAEVAFTSGGTEADQLGVLGALAASGGKRHVVVSAIEHAAVGGLLASAPRAAWGQGVEVTTVRPGADGVVTAESVAAAIRDDTALVALMWANNETGVIQPVREVAATCRERGVTMLVDAVQAAGKLPIDFSALGADLLAIAGHKMHAPQGTGALLVRSGARWSSPYPASHELGRRAGTEGLPGIAGLAAAARLCAEDFDTHIRKMTKLRDRLERVVAGSLGGVTVNGTGPRTANTSNLRFDGIASDQLLARLDRAGIDASNGSACSTKSPEPSHVLLAMGQSRAEAASAVRFSLSRFTTSDEVDRAAAAVIETVETMRRKQRVGGA